MWTQLSINYIWTRRLYTINRGNIGMNMNSKVIVRHVLRLHWFAGIVDIDSLLLGPRLFFTGG
jgi:hypothetical protein